MLHIPVWSATRGWNVLLSFFQQEINLAENNSFRDKPFTFVGLFIHLYIRMFSAVERLYKILRLYI